MRAVLITGANRGIGLELARQYAAGGWQVWATCRHPETAADLRALPGAVSLAALDVADSSQIQDLAQRLSGEALDLLIHNAGWGQRGGGLEDTTYEAWERAMRVNAFAGLELARAFLPALRRGTGGKIVTITSQMASLSQITAGGRYAYRASKAAANMVVRCLAHDLLDEGIAVAALHPGWVRTRLGGPAAPLSAEQSANGIRRVIAALDLETTGSFYAYDGSTLPW